MTKILVVEDDNEMRLAIAKWLQAERHEVVSAGDGEEGLSLLQTDSFDLVVLDWDLPSMSGVDVSKKYRAGKGRAPILMLTGKESIADRVTGLDAGADDYLTKPFSLKELSARVRALLRRPPVVAADKLVVGDLTLDTVKYRLLKKGVEVQLMPRDFALLEFLMKNADMVFSVDALLARVWNNDSEATGDALRTSIKRLRRKLDDGEDESKSVLENIPRVGYRLRVPPSA